VNGLEPTALLNQELDLMPTQENKSVLSEDGKYYSITGQKMWISNAGFCSLFIVFARIGDDKNITGFIIVMLTTEFQWVKKNTN
jgi:alkylation response protein AidB-like acyl-CoA dehydrogenase